MVKLFLIVSYILTVPIANWMIGHVGICDGQGPCVVPVWPGLMAPSPVLVIGLALVFRDLVQRYVGKSVALICILVGSTLSFVLADPFIAVASAIAFFVSELADFAVYTPLQKRGMALAVLASGIVGAVVDSVLFLGLAFGSFDFMAGQVIGKLYASVAFAIWCAFPVVSKEKHHMTTRADQGGYEPRFVIERADGQPIESSRRYMVLSFDGSDPDAVEALRFYAERKRAKNPILTDDILRNLNNPVAAPAQHRYA